MRILLIGEFSNLHATLAEAFRRAGHEVLLVSDGDDWKGYNRDINMARRRKGKLGTIDLLFRWLTKLPKLKGFDIVHFINPKFTDMSPRIDKALFSWLSRHNRHVSLGLYGDDHVVITQLLQNILAYSELQIGSQRINIESQTNRIHGWTVACKSLCQHVVSRAEVLIPCLFEYHHLYDSLHDETITRKLHYIGLPVSIKNSSIKPIGDKVRILFGIQKKRITTKGTDKMLPLFERLAEEYPSDIELIKVENLPFCEYQKLMSTCDVLVDQYYSYTPAMNALEAMSRGIVVVSGGEEDYYNFIGEKTLRPIINLSPLHEAENYDILKQSLLNREHLMHLKEQSLAFTEKYHDADLIAREYLTLWKSLL